MWNTFCQSMQLLHCEVIDHAFLWSLQLLDWNSSVIWKYRGVIPTILWHRWTALQNHKDPVLGIWRLMEVQHLQCHLCVDRVLLLVPVGNRGSICRVWAMTCLLGTFVFFSTASLARPA